MVQLGCLPEILNLCSAEPPTPEITLLNYRAPIRLNIALSPPSEESFEIRTCIRIIGVWERFGWGGGAEGLICPKFYTDNRRGYRIS